MTTSFPDPLHKEATPEQISAVGRLKPVSVTVARHDHGTALSGFLPGAWDHPVASDGTTRRVAPWGLIASGI
ncbi:MAG: hypothetical protein ACRDS9_20125, partial [Pseudonocardiaceae bacterium]